MEGHTHGGTYTRTDIHTTYMRRGHTHEEDIHTEPKNIRTTYTRTYAQHIHGGDIHIKGTYTWRKTYT